MKKIVSFVCAALCCVAMNAQLVTSRSVSVSTAPKAPSRTTWMVRLGLATNNFVGEHADDLGAKIGYTFGFEFNKSMGQRGAYWGMDFTFASRGYSFDEDGYEEKLKLHEFQWAPFTFGWKIPVANSIAIDPHVGIFAAGDIAGKWTFKEDGETEDVKIGDIDDLRRYDIGMKIGVGVWFKNKFNVDLTYQRGFVPVFDVDDSDYNVYQSNFWIRAAYAF